MTDILVHFQLTGMSYVQFGESCPGSVSVSSKRTIRINIHRLGVVYFSVLHLGHNLITRFSVIWNQMDDPHGIVFLTRWDQDELVYHHWRRSTDRR